MTLDELARVGADYAVIRSIVALAADWSAFHLAQNEYQARAVVQKTRELRSMSAEDERERAEVGQEAAAQHPAGCLSPRLAPRRVCGPLFSVRLRSAAAEAGYLSVTHAAWFH